MKKTIKQINLAIILMVVMAFLFGVLFGASAKAETIEEWCKNGREGEKYIGASIGVVPCVLVFPIGCAAIPVGYVVPQLTPDDTKGCVENRKKELGV